MMSELIEGLVQFMARLDYEGLHYDEGEAREALEPVAQLEAEVVKMKTALGDICGISYDPPLDATVDLLTTYLNAIYKLAETAVIGE